jgi:hypothetical protein
MNAQKSEARLPKVEDSGKIGIGGGAINLIKPTVKDKGKIKIGGGAINLIKPVRK